MRQRRGTLFSEFVDSCFLGKGEKTLWFSVLVDRYLTDKYTQTKSRFDLTAVCFSPDNRFLATGGIDHKIRVSLELDVTARPHFPFVLRSGKLARKASTAFLKAKATFPIQACSISYPMAGSLSLVHWMEKSMCGTCALVSQLFSKFPRAKFGLFVVAQMGDILQQEVQIWY